MEFLRYLMGIIEIAFLAYFGGATIYMFIFSVAGLFPPRQTRKKSELQRKFAVLIPGYKEDNVIIEVAESALCQLYPSHLFDVVVIADSFQEGTLHSLRKLPIQLVEVSFEKSTKSKALNKAMEHIGDQYDVALVLDADNIMKRNFLELINEAFNEGYSVVQGHRIAKNTNTPMAILDAISEEVNNHIFRKGHRVLGLSSALIGSGMAFDYHFFKSTMARVNAVGGFDKELELKLLKGGHTIQYVHHAVVLDEKVQKSEVFAQQRKRWLSAQFIYFRRYAGSGVKALFKKGNLDFMDKVYQMVAPPRILLLGIVFLLSTLYFLFSTLMPTHEFWIQPQVWYACSMLVFMSFLLAIPLKFYNRRLLRAIVALPNAFAIMFLSLFKLKGANKKFIHTQHGTINN